MSLVRQVTPERGAVIDVGAGTSPLCARLLDAGFAVTVLDIAASAIDRARQRLGERAARVEWVVADVTQIESVGVFDLWHDRAVFHFLTEPEDRARYVDLLSRSIPSGGHAVIATFAPEGPDQCSGLPVRRYDSTALSRELGEGFELRKSVPETHLTPWGKPQAFQYSLFRRT